MVADDVQTVIERVIRVQLTGHSVDRVVANWGEDFNGDDLLTVDIIIDDDISTYEGSTILSLGLAIKGALRRFSGLGLPLVRFMSQAEAVEFAA